MKKDLIMYLHPDMEIEIFHVYSDEIMSHVDKSILKKLIEVSSDIEALSVGGIYDSV